MEKEKGISFLLNSIKMVKIFLPVITVLLVLYAGLVQASTKDAVKKRGYLECGVSTGLPGFSDTDEKGNWAGLDVDICRAVAAAVLGDAGKVKFISLMAKERVTALLAGEVDILTLNTAWTLTRDTALGIHFAGISFFDKQGYLVSQKREVKSINDLDGATVCSISGTDAEKNLAEDFQRKGIHYKSLVLETPDTLTKAFMTERCDVVTASQTQLYGLRKKLLKHNEAVIFPDNVAKTPFGPAVRQGDDVWLNIVKWSLFAMINAEEMKITSENVDTVMTGSDSRIRRFVGLESPIGQGLGLPNDWAYQIVRQVGSYGESFERNLGMNSSLGVPRGLNALWSSGGILYAPPFR